MPLISKTKSMAPLKAWSFTSLKWAMSSCKSGSRRATDFYQVLGSKCQRYPDEMCPAACVLRCNSDHHVWRWSAVATAKTAIGTAPSAFEVPTLAESSARVTACASWRQIDLRAGAAPVVRSPWSSATGQSSLEIYWGVVRSAATAAGGRPRMAGVKH